MEKCWAIPILNTHNTRCPGSEYYFNLFHSELLFQTQFHSAITADKKYLLRAYSK